MDPRKTAQGDGDERTDENVVRLPRDWLGPREELVPIGSRANAAQTPHDASPESLPPTAASFWDEDSGSLQAPMQAPAEPPGQPHAQPAIARRHRRWLGARSRAGGRIAAPGRGRAAAACGVLAACLIVVLSVIGQSEGSGHPRGAKAVAASKDGPIETGTGVNLARLKAHTPVVNEIKRQPRSHHSVKTGHRTHASRTQRDRRHVSQTRRRHPERSAPRPTHSTSEPVRTITPTPATTPTTSGSAPTTSSSPSSSVDRSTGSTSQQQPAFGATGSLGPGSSPDG